MVRLGAPDYLKLIQTDKFDVSYAGAEANVAVSLANYGMQTDYITCLPDNPIAERCIMDLRGHKVGVEHIQRSGKRMGILYLETGNNAPHAGVFNRNTALHYHYALDMDRMKRAAGDLLGEHDFLAFKSAGTELENTVRTIYRAEWSRQGNILTFDIAGSGFMYNMVRIIAGTLLEIGSGKRNEDSIKRALQSLDRRDAGATAPAHGLMLYRVEYPGFDTAKFL